MQVINEMIGNDSPTQERVAQVYQHQKAFWDSKQIKSRKVDTLLFTLDVVTIHLFIIIFIDLTTPKIQSGPILDPSCHPDE